MLRIVSARKAAAGLLGAVLLLGAGLADAQTSTLKGLIISRDGQTVVVRANGADTPVTLTDTTKIRGTSGALGVRGEDHPPADLIRGLAVEVKTENGAATEVTFKNSDLKTAQQIAAGIAGTESRVSDNAGRIEENSDRIDNVGELVAAGRTKVFFASGSSALTAKGKEDLKAIAEQAKAIKGYRLAVVGRADTTGNAAANQKLSEARAAAVSDYLLKSCGVLPGRILPTAALGASEIAQDPDPPKTPEEARRVTVTIAVSKSASGAPK